jgi:hypothetical protein
MDIIDQCAAQPTQRLYHYTDTAGLLGITKSCHMWATHVRHLNDSEEYHSALTRVEEVLQELLRGTEYGPTQWTPHDALRHMREAPVFVTCFSEMGNLLSQWRAYCPKGGYAIGFDPKHLDELIRNQDSTFAKCIYDETKQDRMIEAIARALIDTFKDIDIKTLLNPENPALVALGRIMRCAALIKNGHFYEEREWRFVSSYPFDYVVHYRPGRFGLTPFLKCDMSTVDLKSGGKQLKCASLTIGPNPDMEASFKAAETFGRTHLRLEEHNEPILPCRIPYRT